MVRLIYPGKKLNFFPKIYQTKEMNKLYEMMLENIEIIGPSGLNGADLDVSDKQGCTPLIKATRGEKFELIKRLVNNGANINACNQFGFTALDFAASRSNTKILQYLVENGDDNTLEKKGSMLISAAICECLENIKYLFQIGVDINYQDANGRTALSHASQIGHLNIIQYLVQLGADWNILDYDERSILSHTSQFKGLKIIEYLIQLGMDINHQARNGDTILMTSCRYGNINNIQYLVQKGADLDILNIRGENAIICAMRCDCLEAAKYLVQCGADLSVVLKKGKIIRKLCKKKIVFDIGTYIKQYQARQAAERQLVSRYAKISLASCSIVGSYL